MLLGHTKDSLHVWPELPLFPPPQNGLISEIHPYTLFDFDSTLELEDDVSSFSVQLPTTGCLKFISLILTDILFPDI